MMYLHSLMERYLTLGHTVDNKRYVTWADIESYVNHVIFDMYKDKWIPDYIVGLTRGGLIPAVMLSHKINVPMHTLKVSLRDHAEHEENLWLEDEVSDGAKVLVVDDINDTGATLNQIVHDWRLQNLPGHNVKFAVLFDNLSSGFSQKVDYCATEINKAEHDEWIVFPWED